MSTQEESIGRIDAGEDAWDEDDEVVELTFRRPLAKVIPVRIAAEQWEALRAAARTVGVGPTTLARMWILERLRQAESAHPKSK